MVCDTSVNKLRMLRVPQRTMKSQCTSFISTLTCKGGAVYTINQRGFAVLPLAGSSRERAHDY
jgi:hypothetical protein